MSFVDVVITTYNRKDLVPAAIRSALSFLDHSDGSVIVVDDASEDDTCQTIKAAFNDALKSGKIRLIERTKNIGVTGAKNIGFENSQADWVIFLDSDDQLLKQNSTQALSCLRNASVHPIVFFRCIDENDNFVGTPFKEDLPLNLHDYIQHTSYGEALTAIQKKIAPKAPYDADLRGFEGLGCSRIIKQYGPALLSNIILRRYDCSREDRLSSSSIFRKRSKYLGKGHLRFFYTFFSDMTWKQRFTKLFKATIYMVSSIAFK